MDFNELPNMEKITLIELAVRIHEIAENKKIPIVYSDFEECADSFIKKAEKLAGKIRW